jgi:hypothetical protein
MTKRLDILFFLLFFFSPWYISAYRSNDDMSIVRQRVLDYMLLPTGQNLTVLAEKALNFTERLNSSCYWPDVDYYDKRFAHWRTVSHLYRITTMLQALTVNGSSVQNDPRIRTAGYSLIADIFPG